MAISNILEFNLLKVRIRAAEKQLDTIIALHKQNVSNGSADPDEFDELYESALMSLVLLKQLEKETI